MVVVVVVVVVVAASPYETSARGGLARRVHP